MAADEKKKKPSVDGQPTIRSLEPHAESARD